MDESSYNRNLFLRSIIMKTNSANKSGFVKVALIVPVLSLSALSCYFGYGVPGSSENRPPQDWPGEIPAVEEYFSAAVDDCGLEVEASTIDFGVVYEGTKSSYPLKLKNVADHAIDVIGANASCGCTTVHTKTPFRLAPGEERELTIQMNSSNNVGDLKKTVTVFVREGQSHFKFPVAVQAHSIALIDVDRREVDFGMVKDSETATVDIGITLNHEADNNRATAPVYVAACPKGVRAELVEVAARGKGVRKWTLRVSVEGQQIPEDLIDGDLVVVTPSTVERVLRIPVRAKQHTFLSCEPARVNFDVVREAKDTIESVAISCLEGHDYEVLSVEIVDGPEFLKAEYDSESGKVSLKIDLKSDTRGFFRNHLQVRYRCDEGSRQTLVIPVSGYRLANGG